MTPRPKKGDELELTVESLAFGGKGVAHLNGYVIFIKGALPDQKVLARLTKRRNGYGEAKTLEILKETPSYITSKCDHFPTCGGCSFQDFDYYAQIEQKKAQVIDLFRRIGHMDKPKLNQVVPAEEIFHYRNKMEFSFSNRRWVLPEEEENAEADFALGLHIPGRFDKILDISTCWIQKPVANEILNTVRNVAQKTGLAPYDIREHSGYLRHLIIRLGERTDEVMVNIVTSREEKELLEPIVEGIKKVHPSVTSIVNNITRRRAGVSYGEWEVLLHGRPTITERLGDFTFEISANSFFQTNSVQGEKLYKIARDFAEFRGDEILYDLYCGTGSTSIFMAQQVKQVYGFEVVPPAVEDAVRNAVSNGIINCRFFPANLDKFFRKSSILSEIEPPDIVFLDPPRAGMHPKLVNDVVDMSPEKIVYISCNPSTQARDVALLSEKGFKLKNLAMVDMFPHTPHIETVALLTHH
ncbi:MAG TPA: 23S rRNA (uracil(1939)-C(5))-methyltransferase RlmD [Candidatus Marinimicrobia bacterium]|nr:23S rRNA (uracil(1939)-C(5))-methyltransferase RlmD [Candidatus Neomarinimicrobiota bacterium]HIN62701.1 23S rRNA (uracil(1939)-C(5))-methyltransferase RlmD [Candidatus Neomarinimicrobiota bacterium]HIO74281.1 23S rRNA (uracil(1939)-C(5))-methyltransferase RlmD [Candidatus Neomarinimicrobiota bacterium]HIO88849.1 23S rRNA (uracil(1939)-C(5))-methyltransferase RlmD [Candidatus Neomarinimicrobiota bacterium]